jgi:phosphoribosylformylglycinamidine (FGAM) synthase-like amidotransferase family enzyme
MRVALLGPPGCPPDLEVGAAVRAAGTGIEVVGCGGTASLRCDAVIVTDAGVALEPVRAFAAGGGPVLGVGRGFAALCEAGLLPGEHLSVTPGPLAGARTHLRVEGRPTPFTWAIPAGRVIHAAGAAPPPAARYAVVDLAALEAHGRVLLRYCDPAGGIDGGDRGDGGDLAGVCDERGNVVGLLPGAAPPAAWWAAGLGRQLVASLCLATRARRVWE